MNIKDIIIARKYATAFLNLHSKDLDGKDIVKIIEAYISLGNNNQVFFLLTLPNIPLSVKTMFIDVFLKKYQLVLNLKALLLLLIEQNRIILLKSVLKEIVNVYQTKKHVLIFDISCTNDLDQQDQDIILEFLRKNTNNEILPIYKIDKSLIAGIRLQSSSFLWEWSIRKQLASTKKLLYKV